MTSALRHRRWRTFVVSAITAVMIAGCSSEPTTPSGASPAGSAAASDGASASSGPIEIVHWSALSASDAEVWKQMIDAFNEAHKDKGVSIRTEFVPEDDYNTKVLAAAAAGQAPDFGWADAGLRSQWIKDGVIVKLDDLAADVGLDLADFTDVAINSARYPQYDNGLYLVPMDGGALAMEINKTHVSEAGLDITNPPQTGDALLEWARAMTQRDTAGNVTRSGIMMTGSGVQPTVTWGIVADQLGFRRASDDLKTACVNPEAGKQAMQWVVDLFDKEKVSTRDVADRYKAFGAGEGSMFWTGPWTVQGYVDQGLDFMTVPMPTIGNEASTYGYVSGLELFTQKDPTRYKATMDAVKWLSDNSFLWTTKGRGAAVRKSILEQPDYKTAGNPWEQRGAFIDSMATHRMIMPIPVLNGANFEIYSGGNDLALGVAAVLAGEKSIDQFMMDICQQWQSDLDAG